MTECLVSWSNRFHPNNQEVLVRSVPMVHILSVDQFFDSSITKALFARATELKLMARWQYPKPLAGKIIATLFYEPSTRTRLSFEAAVTLLGGQVITTESAGHFSSASKGETLEDTIRVVSGYADAIVLRHNEVGAAQRAAPDRPPRSCPTCSTESKAGWTARRRSSSSTRAGWCSTAQTSPRSFASG